MVQIQPEEFVKSTVGKNLFKSHMVQIQPLREMGMQRRILGLNPTWFRYN